VVNHTERGGGTPDLAPGVSEARERLGACVFVENGAVDIEQQRSRRGVENTHAMSVYDLVV
jgi:hypothetical protein